jgi:pantetheine-phosphate adenylyltransferase
MKHKIAVYPGSFDPLHNGHLDVIKRASVIFDKVVVLVSMNPDKKYFFSAADRKKLIEESLGSVKNVEVQTFNGLTVNYLKSIGSKIIVRGLRAMADFEFEMSMAHLNKKLDADVETLLIFSDPEHYFISSRGVREIAQHNGDLTELVPKNVATAFKKSKKRGSK